MTDEQADELLNEIRDLRRELRRMRTGELVARLSEAERTEIAYKVRDLLDERDLTRTEPHGKPPQRTRKRRSILG